MREYYDEAPVTSSARGMPTPAVLGLLIACIALYILRLIPALAGAVDHWCVMVPALVLVSGEVWRAVTYLFIHVTPLHLLFNMLMLWMFGPNLESRWGTGRFLAFYITCGALAPLLLSPLAWHHPVAGASGAILALLTAYAWYNPRGQILLFFVIPMPLWLAVVLTGVVSLALAQVDNSVAHLTHLGGILVALAWLASEKHAAGLYFRLAAAQSRWHDETRLQQVADRQRGYAEQVDPILKKISQQGMSSLTARERATLDNASRRKRERGTDDQVIPFQRR
jgi:membrane associated rhomboid family serine protease